MRKSQSLVYLHPKFLDGTECVSFLRNDTHHSKYAAHKLLFSQFRFVPGNQSEGPEASVIELYLNPCQSGLPLYLWKFRVDISNIAIRAFVALNFIEVFVCLGPPDVVSSFDAVIIANADATDKLRRWFEVEGELCYFFTQMFVSKDVPIFEFVSSFTPATVFVHFLLKNGVFSGGLFFILNLDQVFLFRHWPHFRIDSCAW